jgi:hypothetical protein
LDATGDATAQQFVCGSDAGGSTSPAQGLTSPASGFIGLSTSFSGTALEIIGTASGRTIFANDMLASSGQLIVESLWKRGSGAIAAIPAEYQTRAYLFGSGAAALALETYTENKSGGQPLAPGILFGYKGVFDTNLYRSSGNTLRTDDQVLITTTDSFNRPMLMLDTSETTNTQNIIEMYSDYSQEQNIIFRFTADGNAYADGSWSGGGADLAEWFPTADPGMTPGDLACLDPKRPLHVKRCNGGKLRIIGIVSTKPGFVGGQKEKLLLEGKILVLIGLLGQIPTKIKGDIDIGDIIGLSDTDGVGSRLTAPAQSVCTALEPHVGEGIASIICLAPSIQVWTASISSSE